MSRQFLLPVIVGVATLWCVYAQQEAPTEFEVASIKPFVLPSAPTGAVARKTGGRRGGPGTNDPGQIIWGGATLKALIMTAYDVKNYQVSGPDWLDNQRFDIVAKVPPGATKEQVQVMWQKLLAQRFGLKTHRETRSIPVYEIVVAKGGPKFKESAPAPADSTPPPVPTPGRGPVRFTADANGCPVFPGGRGGGTSMMMMPNKLQLCAAEVTIEQLANMLTNQVSRPVFDKTGLTGKYDFKLEYLPENSMGMMPAPPPGGPPPDGAALPMSESAPPLPAALQSQLGLRLEAKKSPADIVVVDSIEKTPTEN
jgi:uncharacterized protein (TIGR03435 family)